MVFQGIQGTGILDEGILNEVLEVLKRRIFMNNELLNWEN